MEETQNQTPLDQDEDLMDQDWQEDEDLEAGIKGGSVSGEAGDADELDDPLATEEDQDDDLVDSSEYREYGDENF